MAVGYVRESAWAAWRRRLVYVLVALALLSLFAFVYTGTGSVGAFDGSGRPEIDCGTLFAPSSDPVCHGAHDSDLPVAFGAVLAAVVLVLLAVLVIRIRPGRSSGRAE